MTLLATPLSCSAPTQPQPSAAAEQLAKIDPSQIPLAEFGQLAVFVTSQMTDGRNLHLRGLVANPYPEPVEGVRILLRMLSGPSAGARELDRMQKVLDDRLASGAQTALRFDVQTMYAGVQGGGFLLQAFAIKRGDKELPPPPGWRE
jgi:hypothetical protein